MSSKRKALQALVSNIIGTEKEPSFTVLSSEKLDMIKALNFYAVNYRFEHSKAFALRWAKSNMPEIYAKLKEQKDWRFGSYGFVLRMAERGFVLSDEQITKIKAELRIIASISEEQNAKPKQETVAKPKQDVINKALETFDSAVDCVIGGGSPSPAYGVSVRDNREVLAQVERMEGEMRDHPEDFKPKTVRALGRFLKTTKALIQDTTNRVKAAAKPKTKRPVSPAKIVRSLRHKMADDDTGMKGINPVRLVGAKRALIYHCDKRQLVYFEALGDAGLTVTGTSLRNFDPSKSFMKTIRKPSDLLDALSGNTMAGMRKWLADLKTLQKEAKARFSDETVILKV